MWGISDAFRSALTRSHRAVVLADVLDGDGTVIKELRPTGGTVTIDRTRAVRRSCSVSLIDPEGDLVPATATDLLHPASGHELRLWRGISADSLGTAEDELVPLGTFRLQRPRMVDSGGDLTISISGYDRARRQQRARLTDTHVVASGTNYADAIKSLLLAGHPDGDFGEWMTTSRVAPRLMFETGDDRWERAGEMATAIGAELFTDPLGRYVLQPEPDPAVTDPVWSYQEGPDATFLTVGKDLDDERTYNGVIVVGESTELTAPVRAEAWDDDPDSPTYYLGAYGQVPRFYTSSMITTTAQAQEVADALLRRSLGVIEAVMFDAIVNPAHGTSDVVRIERGRVKVDAAYLLERLTMPMAVDESMGATTRQRRVSVA